MEFPRISIVTPNFNGAQYLEETIQSVLNQNYPNLEYIIVDGGSTDDSADIIRKYENQLAYWISEPDSGMYHAIQKGFEKSTGEIMAWINSDDMYHRHAFLTVAEIFQSIPQVNWIVGTATTFDEYGKTVIASPSRNFTKYDFYNGDFKWLQQESTFWRRSLWNNIGATFDLTLKYAGDFALWMKFFANDKLYVTQALIGGFRFRSQNQLSLEHIDDYLREVVSIISSHEISPEDKKIISNYNKLLKIEEFIQKFKLFRTDWMIMRYKNKYYKETTSIVFDRYSLQFTLSDRSFK